MGSHLVAGGERVNLQFFFFSVRSCLEELFSKEYYSSMVL
jgi:hypothetical protein